MSDAAVNQQSNRLAGMSITNSSGNKVSILNDSPLDLEKANIHDEMHIESRPPLHPEHGLPPVRSPRSPHYRDRRDYFAEDRRDPYYPSSLHSSHRHRSESYEAGRSISLTNAATPFRSGFDSLRGADLANSQRSRSLSSGAQLYPYSANGPGSSSSPHGAYPPSGSTPLPHFMRAFSEDTGDEHETYRGFGGHPGLPEGLLAGQSFSKRKYSCTYPGCNKRFTTSGHLARHNRIHTGERNFSCLMPGCPSKFSRQDNMMQHYRTHISPKSRRGASKKQDQQDAENATEGTESEAAEHPSTPHEHHSPSALPPVGLPHQGSRHSSPPRYYPTEQRTEDMDHDEQMERPSSRQQQQHLSPPSHNPHGSSRDPSSYPQDPSRSGSGDGYRPWPVPASPTSPMTRVVERMEDAGGAPSAREQQLFYYRQQQQYQQQYQHQYQQRQQQKHQQQQAASHASAYYHAAQAHTGGSGSSSRGHGYGGHGANKHLASPSSSSSSSTTMELHPHAYSYPHSHSQSSERSGTSGRSTSMSTNMGMNMTMTPPSPQSTPVTPTKYRFDPIQDCLQQERRQREEATL
ncbi:hypothetical protein BG011_002974 [Mortierella polycephala]|uniref:C2H2-type domain-containing protein n=1 Tax=Mortierella polycephala TaxID=41804 RepID=A0A9P6U487_9FUNG|nr:hypothetical protein BG011_002974 [Mortierella polycephala]